MGRDHGEADRIVSGQIETYLGGFEKEDPAWVQAFLKAITGVAENVSAIGLSGPYTDQDRKERRWNKTCAVADCAEMIADATVAKLEAREALRKEAHQTALKNAIARVLEVGCYKRSKGIWNGVPDFAICDVESTTDREVRFSERGGRIYPSMAVDVLHLKEYGYTEAPELKVDK